LTIHQPSADVFDMMDDIILLDSTGALAFTGPISAAIGFFEAAGFPTSEDQNPADVFLDAVSSSPKTQASWQVAYDNSPAKKQSAAVLQTSIEAGDQAVVAEYPTPSEGARFKYLTKRISVQYWRTPGAYMLRLITIILFGFFAGSLYYDLEPTTRSLTEVTGVVFFGLWCSLYLTLGNIPVFLHDRYDAVNNYASGRYSFGTYCFAQFFASLPWQFMCATVFTTLIFWMPFHNWEIASEPSAFIFAICTSFIMMLTMEGFNWVVIEMLQSDMLAVTASMTMLGTFFMFAGFFIQIKDIPWGIRWMAYTVPTKYVFPGHLFNFFDGQTFTNQYGAKIPGETLIYKLFSIDYGRIANEGANAGEPIYGGWRKWMDLLIGLAFVFNFRSSHHTLLKMKNGELGATPPSHADSKEKKKKKKKRTAETDADSGQSLDIASVAVNWG
jgi:ATP-binding cassette subfamily G (WHITE) protein 2